MNLTKYFSDARSQQRLATDDDGSPLPGTPLYEGLYGNNTNKNMKKKAKSNKKPSRNKPRGVKLPASIVEKICDQLHDHIQFYNECGKPDNTSVIDSIRDSLYGIGHKA